MATEWPKQSIVIPVRNEEEYISSTINYILSQDYPTDKLEIIVVDGLSEDNTGKLVEQISTADSRVRLLENPQMLSSAARNIGARNATGEIITYIDGHIYIDNPQLLKNIARLMNEKNVKILSRPQFLETPDNDIFQRAVALARRSVFGHGLDSTIFTSAELYVNPSSSGASYHRTIFEDVGYYDENYDAAEDVEFNFRVHQKGYKSFTSPKLAVHYYPRKNLSGLFKQMVRYGIGRFRLSRKHPGAMSSGAIATALFVAGVPVTTLLLLLRCKIAIFFLGFYALYILLNIFSAAIIASRNGPGYLAIVPAIYATIHWGLGWGFWGELIRSVFRKK